MITRSQSPPMTYRDLRRLPDDLLRHELIDGEHFVSPAPESFASISAEGVASIARGNAR
jgi:hypothetical protein